MNYRSILKQITAFSISAALLISSSNVIIDVHADSSYSHNDGNHNGWTEWTNTATSQPPLPQTNGNYYLNNTFNNDPNNRLIYEIKGNVNFCLNGNNLTISKRGGYCFQFANGTINIFNCKSTKSKISTDFQGQNTVNISEDAKVTIENCSLSVRNGSCIKNGGNFVAKKCDFSGNTGVSLETDKEKTTETQRLENSTFENNLAVNITGSAPVEIVDCTIKSNSNNGINISNGSVTVSISGTNTINGSNGYYGINCNGNLKLSGDNTITGSKGGIYLAANKAIDITGKLTNTEPISIVTAVLPTDETPVVFTNSTDTSFNDPEKFKSFTPGYKVEKNSEGQLQLTTGAKKRSMNVTYTIEPSYTVTIPASINLKIGSSTSADVKVENVCIPNGNAVHVKLSGANPTPNGDKFHIQSGGNTLDYKIIKGGSGSAISVNSEILSVIAGTKESTETLTFVPSDYKYSGTYKGTITFTVSVS